MPRTQNGADLEKWEKEKGFKGVISEGGVKIRRKCVKCDQPTLSLDEAQCPKHGGKRQVLNECQVRGARTRRSRPTARCASAAGSRRTRRRAAAPRAKSCPSASRAPTGCAAPACASAAVEAKREARRAELAQLCEDEGIEEGPADATDAAFGTRYAVLNFKDDYKPYVVVRSGDQWTRACAVRGCTHRRIRAPGTPNTHCIGHGGGHRCAVEGAHLVEVEEQGFAPCAGHVLSDSARSTACPSPSGRGRAAAWAACSGSSRRTRPSRCTCARST